ncbi:peptidoglycan-binding protein [Roseibium polysiphoniae]|uniref:glycoside hydrolase family protein n=1 Tax=Roseibium polysiphoniae TaxID=2571221 RepID=UPI003297F1C1
MRVSEKGVAFIAAHEGFVSRGYLDPAGVVTIGYGFTMRSRVFASWWLKQYGSPLKVGDSLSREEANRLLLTLLDEEYGPPVERALPHLDQTQFDACVSVVYNLGPRALIWKWAKALKAGQDTLAAQLLARTGTTAGGRRLPGLVRRRKDEADLLLDGSYGSFASGSPTTGSRSADIDQALKLAQQHLAQLGYRPGSADGLDGPKTRHAVLAFQRDHPPLAIDGRVGPATRSALRRKIEQGTSLRASGLTCAGTAAALRTSGVDWERVLIAGGVVLALSLLIGLAWRYRGKLLAWARRKAPMVHLAPAESH